MDVDFLRERNISKQMIEIVEDFVEKVTATTANHGNRRRFCVGSQISLFFSFSSLFIIFHFFIVSFFIIFLNFLHFFMQWNCCGTYSASPLPPPHPTTPSLRIGGYQSRIFNGAGRPREVRRIQVQLNQSKSVLCRFVHESQPHVGQLRKILGNEDDCGF